MFSYVYSHMYHIQRSLMSVDLSFCLVYPWMMMKCSYQEQKVSFHSFKSMVVFQKWWERTFLPSTGKALSILRLILLKEYNLILLLN